MPGGGPRGHSQEQPPGRGRFEMQTEIGETGLRPGQSLRLSETLFDKARSGFSTLTALSSNVKAIEASLMFANGLAPFVAIVGPSGWGKSHLLRAAADLICREVGLRAQVLPAAQWGTAGARWDSQAPLLVDDAQDALERPRLRQALRLCLERRVQSGRPTMIAFAAPKVTRTIRSFLPGSRDWQVVAIGIPNHNERELVSRQIAGIERLTLSPALHRLVARQSTWDGNAMTGALRRLRLIQSRWTEPGDVLRALGVLNPYLVDGTGWDLRDHIHEAITAFTASKGPIAERAKRSLELSVYFMIDRIGLSEGDVATYFRLSPGEVYGLASRLARDDSSYASLKAECEAALVASLD